MILLKQQSIHPSRLELNDLPKLEDILRSEYINSASRHQGRSWRTAQSHSADTFILMAGEGRRVDDRVALHSQEGFIKFHFRLTGDRSSLIFNGFGEYEFDRPQLFIASAPSDLLKIDRIRGGAYHASVSLLVRPEFFTARMGLEPQALPQVLKSLIQPSKAGLSLHSEPLTPELTFATRAALAAACAAPLDALYHGAKAVELMCLVIESLWRQEKSAPKKKELAPSKAARLYDVRELLDRHFAKALTLDQLARESGLGKTTLSCGFLQLFGLSVFDYILQKRMLVAHELLRNRERTITEIAEAVGYSHVSNFSVAFRNYFGCSPRDMRAR